MTKRYCPDPQKQEGPQSTELEVALEAIASLRRRVGELEKRGQLSFERYGPYLMALRKKFTAFAKDFDMNHII